MSLIAEEMEDIPEPEFGISDNLTLSQCPSLTEYQFDLLLVSCFLLEGVLQIILSLLGILGNIVSIFLLTRPELRSCFNQLLAVLASYDLLYLFTMMMESVKKLGLETWIQIQLFPYILHPLNSVAMTGSIFMTIAVARERYIAVFQPIFYHKLRNDKGTHCMRILKYFIPITFFSVSFNLPKFFEITVAQDGNGTVFNDVTDLRTNHFYITYYHSWLRLIVIGILPFIIISVMNIKIYMAVKQRKNKGGDKDHLSLILIMIVTTFVVCNLLQLFLNMHEIFILDDIQTCRDTPLGGFPVWSIFCGFISHVLLVINSSANLFIYCIIGSQFRKKLCSYFSLPQCVHQLLRRDQEPPNPNVKEGPHTREEEHKF